MLARTIRSALVPVLVLVAAAATARAQDDPMHAPSGPAPELGKLKHLAGNWEGSGTALMPAPTKWTSQSSYVWALGNHWLQVDTSVQFEGFPVGLRIREYVGWDGENKRYVAMAADNGGQLALTEVQLEGSEMRQFIARKTPEGPTVERWITKVDGDAMKFTMTVLAGSEPAKDVVKGEMKRVANAKPQAIEASAAMGESSKEIARLARMAGTWEFGGEMVMTPGAPAMKLKGTETIAPLFGGTLVMSTTKGTAEGMPGEYEAHTFYAWDPATNRYLIRGVDSMGWIGDMQGWFVGQSKLVMTADGLMMQQPSAARAILELDANGGPKRFTSHSCVADSDPYRSFVGEYRKAGEGKSAPGSK